MAKLAKEGEIAYIGINSQKQSLFHIGNAIVTAETDAGDAKAKVPASLAALQKIAKKSSKNASADEIAETLESLLDKKSACAQISVYGIGRNSDIRSAHFGPKDHARVYQDNLGNQTQGPDPDSLESIADCSQIGIIARGCAGPAGPFARG